MIAVASTVDGIMQTIWMLAAVTATTSHLVDLESGNEITSMAGGDHSFEKLIGQVPQQARQRGLRIVALSERQGRVLFVLEGPPAPPVA